MATITHRISNGYTDQAGVSYDILITVPILAEGDKAEVVTSEVLRSAEEAIKHSVAISMDRLKSEAGFNPLSTRLIVPLKEGETATIQLSEKSEKSTRFELLEENLRSRFSNLDTVLALIRTALRTQRAVIPLRGAVHVPKRD